MTNVAAVVDTVNNYSNVLFNAIGLMGRTDILQADHFLNTSALIAETNLLPGGASGTLLGAPSFTNVSMSGTGGAGIVSGIPTPSGDFAYAGVAQYGQGFVVSASVSSGIHDTLVSTSGTNNITMVGSITGGTTTTATVSALGLIPGDWYFMFGSMKAATGLVSVGYCSGANAGVGGAVTKNTNTGAARSITAGQFGNAVFGGNYGTSTSSVPVARGTIFAGIPSDADWLAMYQRTQAWMASLANPITLQ